MQQHLTSELSGADALVMAAAVADARPISKSTEKIGKATYRAIELTENPDLLAEAARGKLAHQVFVGFAAETGAGIRERGLKKLHSKGVDLLYVTDVSGGKVFGEELTTGSLLSKRGDIWDFVGVDKFELGRKIVGEIAKEMEMANG
jgi:phosphopantothenoylcysteine decarboxylase/phosphopantothenate--cysteine ligase